LQTINFDWEVTLALNLAFFPRRRNSFHTFLFFGSLSGQSRRGYFQRRGEREKKISNVAFADSIFPPRFQKMLWTGLMNAFKPISAIRMNLNQQPNCGSLKCWPK
jgi:hypothetical protein